MVQTVLTGAQLNAFNTTMVARFNAGLKLGKEDWKQVAKLIGSSSESNTYEWMSQFPQFIEWVGARNHKLLAARGFVAKNRKFEATIDIPREKFEDDNYGMYGDVAEGYGQSVIDLMNELVFQNIKSAFSSICYDGQFFFDTDHPIAPNEDGTGAPVLWSNVQIPAVAPATPNEPWMLLCMERAAKPFYLQERMKPEFVAKTSAVNSDTVFEKDVFSYGGRWRGEAVNGFWQLAYGSKDVLNAANFQSAFAAMEKVQGDGSRKLGITPDMLVCGPDNRVAAEQLLKAMQNANGASNINYNKVKLVVTPWLGL